MGGIDEATLRAWRESCYRVLADDGPALCIDVPCPALAALHAAHGVSCSAFVTACNPRSRRLDAAENRRRQAALEQELAALGHVALPAIGEHPGGGWPGEASCLVPGLGREDALALARRHGQAAIVWAAADAIPRLLLC